ncbi:MAG: hypothetical protein DRJ51_02710 [Thermoprotei archaeon]|nr:MAG: hypothetical protein DRJ51_02710 [Thermoprotei archaeon]
MHTEKSLTTTLLVLIMLASATIFTILEVSAQDTREVIIYISEHTGALALYDNILGKPTVKIFNATSNELLLTLEAEYYNTTYSRVNATLSVNTSYRVEIYWLDKKVYTTTFELTASTDPYVLAAKTNTTLTKIELLDSRGTRKLPQAKITLYEDANIFLQGLTADDNGIIRVLLPYGTYEIGEIYWKNTDVKPTEKIELTVDDSVSVLHIEISCRVYDLKLIIKDIFGRALVTGVRVDLYFEGKLLNETAPNSYGEVNFRLLPYGVYEIYVKWSGALVNRTFLTVDQDLVIEIIVPLLPEVTIRVVDGDGEPVNRAVLIKLGERTLNLDIEEGYCTIKNVLSGDYTYIVYWEGRNFTGMVRIASPIVQIELPLYSIHATIKVDKPIDFRTLKIILYKDGVKIKELSPEGTYVTFRRLITGFYAVEAHWYNYTLIRKDLHIVDSSLRITLVLPLYKLRIRVVDVDNQPLYRARLALTLPNGSTTWLLTGPEGYTQALIVPYASYTCKVYWKGVLVAEDTIRVKEDTEWSLKARVVNVLLTLKGFLNQPLSGAEVVLAYKLENGTILTLSWAQTNPEGQVLFRGIPLIHEASALILEISYKDRAYTKVYPPPTKSESIKIDISLDVVAVLFEHTVTILELVTYILVGAAIAIVTTVVISRIKEKKEFSELIVERNEEREPGRIARAFKKIFKREEEEEEW